MGVRESLVNRFFTLEPKDKTPRVSKREPLDWAGDIVPLKGQRSEPGSATVIAPTASMLSGGIEVLVAPRAKNAAVNTS